MIAGRLGVAACWAALAMASPASAQDQPPASDTPQIVIEGRKDLRKDIGDFVGALAGKPGVQQLSRFEDGVCPATVGLTPSQRTNVVERLRRVAKAANIQVDRADCRANVVLVVTPDKSAFLQSLRQDHPSYFSGLSRGDLRRLLAAPGPAVAWQLQGPPVDALGGQMSRDRGSGVLINRTTTAGSRVAPPTRPQFATAIVVVESRALAGLTTTQLADYTAMRAYAAADPARLGDTTAPTILKVLEAPMGAEIPASLTRWDLGFLRGLYDTGSRFAAGQRSAMGKEVAKQIGEASDDR